MLNFILILLMVHQKHCQYNIKYEDIPSYLYHKFVDIKENVFPHDIRINVSLSRISGTLLYSIDRHMNQLIVSLHDAMTPRLEIEFSGQRHYLSLPKLCGCDRCRFEILDLRIQMRDSMYVQCGPRPLEIIKYDRSKQINEVYPMPYTIPIPDDLSPNEAHLWLVNTPLYKYVYPNPQQLSGCIFNVSYNSHEIIFTNITDNIGRGCTKTCIGDICNGGQCYETFNVEPVCNCTKTFLNGRYCNDTISSMNLQSVSQNFIFDMFKVSWITSVNNIASWQSRHAGIVISRNEHILTFEYRYSDENSFIVRSNLSKNYLPNKESILLAYFHIGAIDTWFSNNGTWHHSVIPTNRDLSKVLFETLTVRSGRGNISVAFKTSQKDIAWRTINVIKSVTLGKEVASQNFSPCFQNAVAYTGMVVTMLVLSIVSVLLSVFYIRAKLLIRRYKRKEKYKRKKNRNSLFERTENTEIEAGKSRIESTEKTEIEAGGDTVKDINTDHPFGGFTRNVSQIDSGTYSDGLTDEEQ